MKMLTEPEVAEILRCSTSKVKRLRLRGALPYYPGRPVLIAEADLLDYLEGLRREARRPLAPEEKQKVDIEGARQWALKAKLFKRRS